MIMHSDSEHPLGACLTNHIFVQHGIYIRWRRHAIMALGQRCLMLFTDNIHT